MVDIIATREQVTPQWLTQTLAAAGIEATVDSVEIEPILAGYYGSSSRLRVTYSGSEPAAPRSFFLKLATDHPSALANAARTGMYRYEVSFYRELAPWVNISTPRCYAAEIAEDNSAFVLLLEDAAPLRQIDQLQGLNLDQARLAMRELAGLHASTWQGRGMDGCDWARTGEVMADAFAQGMVQLTPQFVEQFSADLSAENIELLHRLSACAERCFRYSLTCKNQVSTHCDYRADNLLFGERDGELAMVAIDWTGMLTGGGRDLCHFLGTSLQPALRRAHEEELLQVYHETLLAQGVNDFSWQECFDDYRRSLIYPVFVVVSSTASVQVDERGRKLFLSMFNRACEAIRDTQAMRHMEAL